MLRKNIIIIVAALAAVLCTATAYAGQVDYVNIDDAIVNTVASSTLSQENGGEIKYNLYTGDSLAVTDGDIFTISSPKYSFYKSHLITQSPATFAASGKQLITVLEIKFKAELKDPEVEYKPKINYGLRYVRDEAAAAFIENQQESSHIDADGEWIELKYEFNPVTGLVRLYKNGEKVRELTDEKLKTGDIEEIRFYPRTIPEKNGEGKYPNGNATLNFGDDDGTVLTCTPVIWTFDYVKIYQLEPFEIVSSEPDENGAGASVSGPFRVTFDTAMDAGSFNPSTVQLELEADDTVMMAASYLSADDTCEVMPFGNLEFFSRYRLAILSGVKDINGFGHSEPKYVSFTTAKRDIAEDIAAGEIRFTVDSAETDVLKNGKLCGSYLLENSADAQEITVSTVLYKKGDGVDAFISESESTVTLEAGSNELTIPEITVDDAANCIVKVMVWTIDGYPLTDAVELTAEQA